MVANITSLRCVKSVWGSDGVRGICGVKGVEYGWGQVTVVDSQKLESLWMKSNDEAESLIGETENVLTFFRLLCGLTCDIRSSLPINAFIGPHWTCPRVNDKQRLPPITSPWPVRQPLSSNQELMP